MQRHKIAAFTALALLWACGNDEGRSTTAIELPGTGGNGQVAPVGGTGNEGGAGSGGRANTADAGGSGLPGVGGDWQGPNEDGDLPGGGPIDFEVGPQGPGWPSGTPKQEEGPGGSGGSGSGSGSGSNTDSASPGWHESVGGLGQAPAGTPGKVHAKAGSLETTIDYTAEAEAAATVDLIVRTPKVSSTERKLRAKVVVRAQSGSGHVKAGTRAAVVVEVPGSAPVEADAEVDGDGLADIDVDLPEGAFAVGVVVQASVHAKVVGTTVVSAKVGVELAAKIELTALVAPGASLQIPVAQAAPGAEFQLTLTARTVVNPLEQIEVEVQGDGSALEILDATFDGKFEGSHEAGPGTLHIKAKRGAKTAISSVTGTVEIGKVRVRVKAGATLGAKAWIKIKIVGMFTLADVPLVGPGSDGAVVDADGAGNVGHVLVAGDQLVGLVAVVANASLFNTAVLDGKHVERKVRTIAVWASGKDEDVDASLESEDKAVCTTDKGLVKLTGGESRGASKLQILAKWKGATAVCRVRVYFPGALEIRLDDPILNRVAGAPAACAGFGGYQHTKARAIAGWDLGDGKALFEADVSGHLEWSSSQPTVASCDNSWVRGIAKGEFILVARGGPKKLPLAQRKASCSDEEVSVEALEALASTGLSLQQVGPPVPPGLADAFHVVARFKQQLHVAQKSAPVLAWARCSDGARMPVTEAMGLTAELSVAGIVELAQGPLRVVAVAEGQGKVVLAKWGACGAALGQGWVWIRVQWSSGGGGGGTGNGGGGDSGGGGGNGGGSGGNGGGDNGGGNGGGDNGGGDNGGGGNGGGGNGNGGGGGGGSTCVDVDGDGFGANCPAGADCDDANPNFALVCPDCSKNAYPGCACTVAAQNCYSGDPLWIGKGECTAGVQLCQGGFWGSCQSEVLPTPEACDGKDNNCNGLIDEGVLSSCGTCDLSCTSQQVGPDLGTPFTPGGDNSKGVTLDQNGYLVLSDKSKEVDLNHIWIANSAEHTVSKLNTKNGKEVGRYNVCPDPSRTAVDLNGDVWVGCRAGAAVAKVITDVTKCTDKNGNGKIDTSFDADNNGVISKSEMLPQGTDECIKFIVKPPGVKFIRAVGVDKENHGWVGDWYGKVLWRLHPDTGAVVDTVNIGCNPYGITIDQKGTIWVAGRGCAALLAIDPKTKAVQQHKASAKYNPYGINVDIYGKIWVGNCCDHHAGYRYDPVSGKFDAVGTMNRPRGVATSIEGFVFVANDLSNSVAKINAKTLKNEGQVSLGSGRFPIGMAIDYDGFVWAVNQQKGSATKIDPKTMQVVGEYPVGKGPYTYSDMTGYTLHHFTAPRGHYTTVFGFVHAGGTVNEYTKNKVEWQQIQVDAIVPTEAYVKVRYRVADDLKALESAQWSAEIGPFPPLLFPLQLGSNGTKVVGRFLQVDVILQAGTDKKSPVVKSISANGKQLDL
ncbi:MAG: hypothetical protein H6747_12900 [Deltaproteobacteria bacterium]|nr:hypothetical protein [Deltaproteobacteria bacterium]